MKNILTTVALTLLSLGAMATPADAQNAILAEIYGRGVHAFYAGQHQQSYDLLSSAINGGSKDPRAYYFRGIVSTMLGRSYEAESDWRQGATIEAQGQSDPAIGRSLSRFQGSARLKLEQIRQTARLQALTSAVTRSQIRSNQLQSQAPAAYDSAPKATPGAAAAVTPPPAPPADENPFAGDPSMAAGTPKVESDDALAGATGDPFKDDSPAGAAPADAGGDVFGGGDAGADMADPFGGGDGGADMADPFGGGGDADPFGGGGDMADPFGN